MRAPRVASPWIVLIVDTAAGDASAETQVARWIAAESHARGFEARVATSAEERSIGPADVVFLLLHGAPPEWSPDDPTVPWERWAGTAETLAASGAVVIVVSSGARAGAVAACMRSGASAVIDVEDAKRGFDIVGDVADGTVRSSELLGLLPCPFPPSQLARLCELSTNETRVLFYLTCGFSAERIASILWSSVSTIRAHIRSIFRKLGVKSQIAAVACANGTASTDLEANDYDGREI